MKTIRHQVAGQPVRINVAETEDDLKPFRRFIRDHIDYLGVDSETTGLNVYSQGFRCRLVQFGTATESWVVPVELGPRFQEDVRVALQALHSMVLHNAAFDLQVFERCLGVPMGVLWPRVRDTYVLAHLVDPRDKKEGGTGHSLEDVTGRYIDAEVAEGVKNLMGLLAKERGTTLKHVWWKVPLNHPLYLLYAGMDPILACRADTELSKLVPRSSIPLIPFEIELAEVCAYIERTGFLLDVEYTRGLSDRLKDTEDRWAAEARRMGCENVNATEQVADVIEARGRKILGRTAKANKRQVNDELLSAMVAEGDEFARAVVECKRAGKQRTTWPDNFLKMRDAEDRCHPCINPLRARTARMSITGIPAQTLPKHPGDIRRCFLADKGHSIVSVDYRTQELRVLAALSEDPAMIRAFRDDLDLHLLTARAAFGPHVQKGDPERQYGKVVNFVTVYGGGPKAVMQQTGLGWPAASRIIEGFNKAYPQVPVLSAKLQAEARANGSIVTPTGRVLPVDADKPYAATDYIIQSTSRDVTARAMLRLHKAGWTPYVRLPLHDEILASVPTDKADWAARRIGDLMAERIGPVLIDTEPEVGLRSWGSLYGMDY